MENGPVAAPHKAAYIPGVWQDRRVSAKPRDSLSERLAYMDYVCTCDIIGASAGSNSLTHSTSYTALPPWSVQFPFSLLLPGSVHVHTHSFILSQLCWCFLELTLGPKSQILKMGLVEYQLVNPYER